MEEKKKKKHDTDLTYVRDYNVHWTNSTHGCASQKWVEWSQWFHFTDEMWTVVTVWCWLPPKEGSLNLRRPGGEGGMRGSGRGFMGWKMWVDGSDILIMKKCWGSENDAERERTCMSAQALLSILVTSEAPSEAPSEHSSTQPVQRSCSATRYKTEDVVLCSSQVWWCVSLRWWKRAFCVLWISVVESN